MDRRERMGDLTLLFQAALDGQQSNIWTALPGQYVNAGSKTGTANVQPTVQGRFINQDGETWGPWQNLPVCQDCPISWPGGSRGRLVWPLAAGDEGLIVFASRCIDNWWLQGGSQPPAMIRMHDLSDGIFIPGIFSQPNAPAATTPPANMRLTSNDGLTYIELNDVGQVVNVVAPGGINLDGPMSFTDNAQLTGNVKITGTLEVTGAVTVDAGMTVTGALAANGGAAVTGALTATGGITAGQGGADSVTLQGHTHSYQEPTGASAPAPTAAPKAGT
jgi:hypothetical protein